MSSMPMTPATTNAMRIAVRRSPSMIAASTTTIIGVE